MESHYEMLSARFYFKDVAKFGNFAKQYRDKQYKEAIEAFPEISLSKSKSKIDTRKITILACKCIIF